jgi:uncharacterized membrane protein YeaQ/YmgE (transglycosylase-associated protein family)
VFHRTAVVQRCTVGAIGAFVGGRLVPEMKASRARKAGAALKRQVRERIEKTLFTCVVNTC